MRRQKYVYRSGLRFIAAKSIKITYMDKHQKARLYTKTHSIMGYYLTKEGFLLLLLDKNRIRRVDDYDEIKVEEYIRERTKG